MELNPDADEPAMTNGRGARAVVPDAPNTRVGEYQTSQ